MEEDAKSRPAIRELQKPEEKSTNLAVQQLLNQIDTGESMSPKSIAQAARKEAASIPRVEVIKAVDPEAVVVSDTTLGKTIGEGKECATSGEEVVEVTSSLGKLPDDVKVAKELIIIDSTPTADIGPGHETWRESLLKLRTLYPGGGNYSGVGMDTDTVDDLGMFERILQMRDDLNKAVERQVIKHQNVMLQQNWNLDVRAIHSSNNIPLGTINDEDETVDYNPSAQMGYMGGYVDPSTNVYSSNLRTEPEVSKSQDDSNMSDDLTDDGTN